MSGVLECLFQTQNPNQLKIMKIDELISHTDTLTQKNQEDSDSDEERISHLTVETKLVYKIILFKAILNSVASGIDIDSRKVTTDAVYSLQHHINKLLNLKECKEKLLILPTDSKTLIPSAQACTNTFTFVSTMLELFANYLEAIPSTFNIEHYVPIWLSFWNMRAWDSYKDELLKNLLKVFKNQFSNGLDSQSVKTLSNIISSVLKVMMNVKSLNTR